MMMGLGMGIWGIFLMVLFWGGLVALAVWLVGLLFPVAHHRASDPNQPLSAEEILRTRFVRGEITSDDYRRMQETLQDNRQK